MERYLTFDIYIKSFFINLTICHAVFEFALGKLKLPIKEKVYV